MRRRLTILRIIQAEADDDRYLSRPIAAAEVRHNQHPEIVDGRNTTDPRTYVYEIDGTTVTITDRGFNEYDHGTTVTIKGWK